MTRTWPASQSADLRVHFLAGRVPTADMKLRVGPLVATWYAASIAAIWTAKIVLQELACPATLAAVQFAVAAAGVHHTTWHPRGSTWIARGDMGGRGESLPNLDFHVFR